MLREDIINKLLEYGEDIDELEDVMDEDLLSLLEEYEDRSDLFPNGDEYDGSHEYD